MTDTPGDDVAAMDEDAGSTVRSDDEGRPDLPGVTSGDADPLERQVPAEGNPAAHEEVGLGDGDDVEPGAGAVEPPD
jgi:hypothetical protein